MLEIFKSANIQVRHKFLVFKNIWIKIYSISE
jgi:hypothetical protein